MKLPSPSLQALGINFFFPFSFFLSLLAYTFDLFLLRFQFSIASEEFCGIYPRQSTFRCALYISF